MTLDRMTLAVATAVFCVTPAAAASPSDDTTRAPNQLAFLEAGKDYVIRFLEGHNILRTTTTETTRTTIHSDDGQKRPGKQARWTLTFSVRVFHVVRFGGGSWVLLRHPSDPKDAAAWFGKRQAMAILNDAASIQAENGGGARLKKLRECATREIETSETWFNLNHAVAIANVPKDD